MADNERKSQEQKKEAQPSNKEQQSKEFKNMPGNQTPNTPDEKESEE